MIGSVFREYDVRGIVDREIDAVFARRLGEAYACYFRERFPEILDPKISIAWDCRLSSDSYACALIQGLQARGFEVVRLGVCPTPLMYFSLFQLPVHGGIMVTGSHNPPHYNGFKISMGQQTIYGEQIQELRRWMEKIPPKEVLSLPLALDFEIIPVYQRYLMAGARTLKPMKIVLDAGSGTAGAVAPELFARLGACVVPLYCQLDGRFPHHHPDPTVAENLKDLQARVLEEKADFGIAFDGDSDRIGAVDEQGHILFGDDLMILFARSVLQELPGATIISEVKASRRLYEDIQKKGGIALMWKTGHSLIKAKMKEVHAALAGEMSGHIFFADRYFGFDDGIYAALRLYEIASVHHPEPLSSLLSDLTRMAATPEIRVDCDDLLKFQLVEAVKRRLHTYKINDIDGVRVDFEDGWALVRASHTQPSLVLRFEALTDLRLQELRSWMRGILEEAAQSIGYSGLEMI
jgi:phosphomannomutase/phosphoglucomutase